MNIEVFSRGKTLIEADGEYQEPAIRAVLESGLDDSVVAAEIVDYTDTEKSNISYDDYVVVTEDDGRLLWQGWLYAPGRPAPELWQEAGE